MGRSVGSFLKLINFLILILLFFPLKGSKSFTSLELIQVDCAVFDWSGKIYKKYPGWMCIFFDDGSYVSDIYLKGILKNVSATGSLIWRIQEEVHHELDLSLDKKMIYYLSDDVKIINGKRVRYDVFKIINRQGVELSRWSFYDHWGEIEKILEDEKKQKAFELNFSHPKYGPMTEFTHANSLKEIPENKLYPEVPYLKPGNLIAGINCLGFIMIFNPTLTRIEKVFHYQQHLGCNIHDTQVLSSGEILFFRNFDLKMGDGPSLVKINPLTGKTILNLATDSSDPMKSSSQGSVQELENGNLLYIDKGQANHMGVVEISKDGKIVRALDQRMLDRAQMDKPYRARSLKLRKFLEKAW